MFKFNHTNSIGDLCKLSSLVRKYVPIRIGVEKQGFMKQLPLKLSAFDTIDLQANKQLSSFSKDCIDGIVVVSLALIF